MHNEFKGGDEPIWDGTHYRRDKLHKPAASYFPGPRQAKSPAPIMESPIHVEPKLLATPASGAHRSDGGSTDYYAIPEGTRDLDDLIDGLGMSFRIANIFKACMRFGKKDGTSQLYDLNKIIFFATRERDKLLKVGTEVCHIDLPLNRSVE